MAVLLTVALLVALGVSLVLSTTAEGLIAGNYRSRREAVRAAGAALERAFLELTAAPDWSAVLDGRLLPAWRDGPPGGIRQLPDGTSLDLGRATSLINCGRLTTCSEANLNAVTGDRPWGPNNPRWQLFGFGPYDRIIPPGPVPSSQYVVVWVADDPAETDGDPLTDGATPGENPGSGLLMVRAEARGGGGGRVAIEAVVQRVPPPATGDPDEDPAPATGLQLVSWREVP